MRFRTTQKNSPLALKHHAQNPDPVRGDPVSGLKAKHKLLGLIVMYYSLQLYSSWLSNENNLKPSYSYKSNPLFLFQVAAAYAYGFDNRNLDGINLLVFDFGGGTFDVSIIWVCFLLLNS